MSIITSLLDTDLYKFTMCHAARKTCQRNRIDTPKVQYRFKCRNKKNLLPYMKEIIKEIEHFQELKFSQEEINYLMSLGYFDSDFAGFLHGMNLKSVQVMVYEMNKELNIDIEGPWTTAIFFEVPVLAIVNEIYFKHQKVNKKKAVNNLINFCDEMVSLRFSDFGTRRRFSKNWQETCIIRAFSQGILTGTSNVYFSMKHRIRPVGTMAHEWFQAFQVLSKDIRNFQKDALNEWMLTYRGKLDTALTDILGIDAFLKDWDSFFANNYSCLRHDSGCPFEFIRKVKEHYNDDLCFHKYPAFLFSDGLTPEVCLNIKAQYPTDKILFGIGTNFTNNVGLEPLQIVIKLNKVNGQNVIKLSDSPGKVMCEDKNLIYTLKQTFNLKGY